LFASEVGSEVFEKVIINKRRRRRNDEGEKVIRKQPMLLRIQFLALDN